MPEYTRAQDAAIRTIDHNLQIIACAGSGKTEVVAQRVVELLREKGPEGILPANIVAFTFTEKAAAELKDRIVRSVTELAGPRDRHRRDVRRHDPRLLPGAAPGGVCRSTSSTACSTRCKAAAHRQGIEEDGSQRPRLKRWVESKLTSTCEIVREADVDPASCSRAAASSKGWLTYQDYLDRSATWTSPRSWSTRWTRSTTTRRWRPSWRAGPLRHRGRVPGREPDPGAADLAPARARARTSASSATTTRPSTSGAAATCRTS